jgi:acetylornithine deacetylase/succinyl-diaminopimelate desuccinylase-like protein
MTQRAEALVNAAIAEGWPRALEDIRTAIRQPSVSRTGEGVQAMADWLCAYLAELGASVRQVPGQRAPIVEGELTAGADRPTLLFYELYDVQPAEGQPGWTVPPFAAEIVTDAAGRRRLVGRGAFNSKGPLLAALATLRCFAQAGVTLPCDIRFLIEGEEEIGSPSLPGYIAANLADLRRCDAAFIPYFGTNARGQTVLRLGFKGLALLELSVTGGDWGGPARGDVHALHGALVDSPAWHLLRALHALLDADGRLCVPGLEALVPPPDPADRALAEAAAERFDPAEYAAEIGVRRLKHASLDELLFACTLNIDALQAGRIEAGDQAATLIPRVARALLDLRVAPGVAPADVVALMRAQLDRAGLPHAALAMRSAYPASRVAPDSPPARALVDACRANADDLLVLPIHAGAAPMHVFSDTIGIPYAFGGVGHGAGAHGPNEYIMVDDIAPFMRTVAGFLLRFGR